MTTRIGYGIVATLLVAGGCGSGGLSPDGKQRDGSAGTAGGAGGSAGGEPAAGGATGNGTAGTGAASAGSSGAGTAGGTGGATSSAGSGGGGGTGGAAGGGGGAGTTWLTPPPMAPALAVPAGATLTFHAHAVGAQIYTCTASGGADAGATTFAWALKAPDAKLFDSGAAQVGTHGAGPSWTHVDGSVAHGVKVIEVPSPSPDAISWLLLRVSSTDGAGAFGDVTYVQRLSTVGGKAPATGCDAATVGTDTRSSYMADYYFYTGGAGAAWLATPKVPDAIALPAAMKLREHDHAIGFQIYGCLANGGADAGANDAGATTYAWVFKAPNALLYDMTFVPVASHSAGPTWTSTDGSVVTARELARADSPLPDAIPWLLLKELSASGPGVFSDVAIVQRLNTVGGKVPTTGCDAAAANTEVRVPYSADYYFYVSADADAGAGG